ncbi:MAG: FAD-dependent oxidoreductase [Alcanivoracaceae bacterium]|nr:FAD-dependent oxidoreductase [Alcanivoracaceae bacterium]
MKKHEIVIVGSGIIGICCALKLQLQGHQVLLIDKNDPASGCSMGNAGHFATEQIFPMASASIIKQLPSLLIKPNSPLSIKPSYLPKIIPWMMRFLMAARREQFTKGTHALKSLNDKAMQAYEDLIKASASEHLIKKAGYLLVFEGKKAQQ